MYVIKSIKTIYKIGYGPSSSHTMGPSYAASNFLNEYPDVDEVRVILYGSLAKIGKGHATDRAIKETIGKVGVEIVYNEEMNDFAHPNTVDFIAFKSGTEQGRKRYYSIGGEEIRADGDECLYPEEIYSHKTFTEIASYCKSKNIRLSDSVFDHEGSDIKTYLLEVWKTMQNSISEGLSKTGIIPGGLDVERKTQFRNLRSVHLLQMRMSKRDGFPLSGGFRQCAFAR